jgi:hypothetical protein
MLVPLATQSKIDPFFNGYNTPELREIIESGEVVSNNK